MTKEEFNEWKDWHITREIMLRKGEVRESRKERMVEIGFGSVSPNDIVQMVKLAGFIVGMNEFLDMTYEDFEEQLVRPKRVMENGDEL